ncbi:MAG: hypothetical protein ABSC25_24325 [Roseiarcus sp.]
MRDKDTRVAFLAEVARPCCITLAAPGIGAAYRDQRAASRRQRRTNRVKDGAVGIGRAGFVGIPKRNFIGDDRDGGYAADASERSGSNFDVDAIREG